MYNYEKLFEKDINEWELDVGYVFLRYSEHFNRKKQMEVGK